MTFEFVKFEIWNLEQKTSMFICILCWVLKNWIFCLWCGLYNMSNPKFWIIHLSKHTWNSLKIIFGRRELASHLFFLHNTYRNTFFFFFLQFQLNIHRFKCIARFGLSHIVATNLCVWIRTVVKECTKEISLYRVNRGHGVSEDYMILGMLY